MIPYKHFCDSEEIVEHLRKLLDLFGLIPNDFSVSVTDCGADVQNVADIFGWLSIPCLAHVINLCVKKLIFTNPDDDNIALDESIEDPSEDADDIAVGEFQDTMEIMRRVT